MNRLRSIYEQQKKRIKEFTDSDSGKIIIKVVRHLFHLLIIAILIWQIWTIGVTEVIRSVPVNPLFYTLFLLLYAGLPLSEYFIYKRLVPLSFLESQWVFHYKRIYNKFFIGYSGEVYLFAWMKKRFNIPKKKVFAFIRDNNSLSVVASWLMVATIALWLLLTDKTGLTAMLGDGIRHFFVLFIGILALFVIFASIFKGKLYSLNPPDTAYIFTVHVFRTLLLAILQVLQWFIIIPGVGVQLLINFLALQMVIGKIPFIPNKDLIYISLSLYLARATEMPLEEFSGILIIHMLLEKGFSLLTLFRSKKIL